MVRPTRLRAWLLTDGPSGLRASLCGLVAHRVKCVSMNFEQALRYLLSLGHETMAMKLGLRNTELLLENLGNPHQHYESVQIAGTNGKGSTAVMLDSICRSNGIRTGLYTSPHLVSITERIRIAGQDISKADFAELATQVRSARLKIWLRKAKLRRAQLFLNMLRPSRFWRSKTPVCN